MEQKSNPGIFRIEDGIFHCEYILFVFMPTLPMSDITRQCLRSTVVQLKLTSTAIIYEFTCTTIIVNTIFSVFFQYLYVYITSGR